MTDMTKDTDGPPIELLTFVREVHVLARTHNVAFIISAGDNSSNTMLTATNLVLREQALEMLRQAAMHVAGNMEERRNTDAPETITESAVPKPGQFN